MYVRGSEVGGVVGMCVAWREMLSTDALQASIDRIAEECYTRA
jgi:hypothetical protein